MLSQILFDLLYLIIDYIILVSYYPDIRLVMVSKGYQRKPTRLEGHGPKLNVNKTFILKFQ